MIKIKFNLYILLILAVFGLYSCKDTPTNPSEDGTAYFQFATGNYWIYTNDSLDLSGKVMPGYTTKDSTVVAGTETKNGKLCYKLTTVSQDGSSTDSYYYKDGSSLYILANDLGVAGFDFNAGGFMKVADFNSSSWTVADTSIKDSAQGMEVVLKLTITGSKGTNKTINVNGTSIDCKEFIQSVKVAGTIAGFIPLNVNFNIKFYFGKNIGLVERIQEGTKITIPTQGDMVFNGLQALLTNYKVTVQ